MMTDSELPLEILQSIFHYISDHATLCALCLTDRTSRSVAQAQLYSSVNLVADRNLARKFLTSIRHAPHLAVHVTTLYFETDAKSNYSIAFWQLVLDGMKAMRCLKVLTFREMAYGRDEQAYHAECLDADKGIAFQLEKLHWHIPTFPEMDAGIRVHKVLNQQRLSLRDLSFSISDQETMTTLDPISFPRLEILTGRLAFLRSFLPGSPVTNLTWSVGWGDVRSPGPGVTTAPSEEHIVQRLQPISTALHEVNTFTLREEYTGLRPRMQVFHGLLLSLEVLRLAGSNRLQELHDLHALSTIRELVLTTARRSEPSGLYPREGHETITTELFDKYPNLMLIDIKHRLLKDVDVAVYRRWKRGKSRYVEITENEVMEGRFK